MFVNIHYSTSKEQQRNRMLLIGQHLSVYVKSSWSKSKSLESESES